MTDPVASAYDRWSRTYETVENPTRDLAAFSLRRQSLPLSDRDVLEIGCGTGRNTGYLSEGSRSVVAVDFSAGMLEEARTKFAAPNVRFESWDIRSRWTPRDRSIDLIVCMLVLEHVRDLRPVFLEAARVLRPGGEAFVCELHPFRQYQGHQARFVDPASGETVLVTAYTHDVSDYVDAALRSGFELAELREWKDEGEASAPPRLLSLRLRIPGRGP